MAKPARVAISSFRTPERGEMAAAAVLQGNADFAASILNAAGVAKSDIALLPEAFALAGLPSEMAADAAEPVGGPTTSRVAELAKRWRMNIVAGHIIEEGGTLFNAAIIYSRAGEVIGIYRKAYPYPPELKAGIRPGNAVGVFDTDIGRVALAICFDVNWPQLWRSFADQDADLVCWISAYGGGFPLQSLAWQYQLITATSVSSDQASIVDISGQFLHRTSKWTNLAIADVALDRDLYHIDEHAADFLKIQNKYGDAIAITGFSEENFVIIESRSPDVSIRQVEEEFSLRNRRTYLENSGRLRDECVPGTEPGTL